MPNPLDVKYHLPISKVFGNVSPYSCIVWYVISTHVIATKMSSPMIVDKQLYFSCSQNQYKTQCSFGYNKP